ncbi:MAG TPA: aspartyl protease family protein [Blastocatellia bacterium]|nr:aspartyl protease family protein [Blastocatellia bacterium]
MDLGDAGQGAWGDPIGSAKMVRSVTSIAVLCLISLVLGGNWVSEQTGQAKDQSPVPSASAAAPSSLTEAGHLYRTGNLDAALELYNRIVESDPKSALAYVGVARVYLKQNKPAEAFTAAQKAVELSPTLDAAREALAEVHFRQGKIVDAERELDALINANTKEARAYLELSRIYRCNSWYKHEKEMIDRAHELDPNEPDIQKAWIQTLSLQQRLKALQEYLRTSANDDPELRRALERQLFVMQDEARSGVRGCHVANKISSMETPLVPLLRDPQHLRGYALAVKVNGVSSHLLLDTGAFGILVDSKIAEKAGLKPLVTTDLKGIGDRGAASGYYAYADSIKIGELEFEHCMVEVIDQKSVIGDDGLIGANVFSKYLVDINFPDKKFALSPLPPRPEDAKPANSENLASSAGPELHDRYIAPEMKSYTPVLRFGDDLLIHTRLNGSPPKLFIIDTGAFDNSISPVAAKEVTKISSDSNMSIRGLSGKVDKVFRTNDLTIQFGYLQQRREFISFDTKRISDSIGTEVSGFLGFGMLWLLDIKIDYRDGLVDFQYDGNRIR